MRTIIQHHAYGVLFVYLQVHTLCCVQRAVGCHTVANPIPSFCCVKMSRCLPITFRSIVHCELPSQNHSSAPLPVMAPDSQVSHRMLPARAMTGLVFRQSFLARLRVNVGPLCGVLNTQCHCLPTSYLIALRASCTWCRNFVVVIELENCFSLAALISDTGYYR